MKKRMMFTMVALAIFAVQAEVKTIYVDCKLKDYAGHDGSTAALAYETIQEGVEAASAGDTVLVASGTYDKGGAVDEISDGGNTNRVLINRKAITLKGAGATNTFVVGSWDPSTLGGATAPGLGSSAVRCLCIVADKATEAPTVQGFTFRDGATHYVSSSDRSEHSGGGVLVATPAGSLVLHAIIADCIVCNCLSSRGGGVRGGKYVRCHIDRCDSFGMAAGGRDCSLYGCLVTRCGGRASNRPALEYVSGKEIVNCTFAGNYREAIGSVGMPTVYNTVFNMDRNAIPAGLTMYKCLLYSTSTAVDTCIVPADDFQLFSPATGDYRLVSTSTAVGAGDVSYLDLFPSGYADKDLLGNARKTGSKVNIGAIESVGIPASGYVCLKAGTTAKGFKVNGYETLVATPYFRCETYPTMFSIETNADETLEIVYLAAERNAGCADEFIRFYPDLNGVVRLTPPPTGYQLFSVNFKEAELWVDKEYAVGDSTGSSAKPYVTIQDAVDASKDNTVTVIHVRPGDYDTGGAELFGLSNRVAVSVNKRVKIVSTDGPSVTTIRGAHDSSDRDWGCGAKAVRCVATESPLGMVQGFTLADGATAYQEADTPSLWGGGMRGYGSGIPTPVLDCVFTNCTGSKGGAATYAALQRCRIVDCKAQVIGLVRNSFVCGCLFDRNALAKNNACFLYDCKVAHTTLAGTGHTGDAANKDSLLINSIFRSFNTCACTEGSEGNCFWDCESLDATCADAGATVDPCLASPGVNDRPLALSPALTAGRLTCADYWKYAISDYESNPYALADGRVVAGAYQTTEPCLALTSDVAGGIEPSGTNWAVAGSSVTVTARRDRPFIGFEKDGEVVGTSQTLVIDIPAVPASVTTLKALYSDGHWYVDADQGDDARGGGTKALARKTLASALTNAVSGDVVTALPGTYKDGVIEPQGTWTIPARASVPSGVVLESEQGSAETVIEGRYADTEDPDPFSEGLDPHRMGPGGVRCVYLAAGATIRGFTLRKGRTRLLRSTDQDSVGAGIWAMDATAMAENCTIADCAAYRGGGCYQGTCRNCTFDGNIAFYGGTSASDAYLYGCVSRNGESVKYSGNVGIFHGHAVVNCTVLDGVSQMCSYSPMQNSLFLGNFSGGSKEGGYVYVCSNCLFKTGCGIDPYWMDANSCRVLPESELAVDADGRPVIGSNAAVDAANPDFWVDVPATDSSGAQRIYNGRFDIGALEADWRPVFASLLSRRATVSAASPTVTTNQTGGVRLNSGDRLDVVYRTRNAKTTEFQMDCEIPTAGALSYVHNESEPVVLEGPTAGESFHKIDDGLAENDLSFTFDGGEAENAYAVLRRFRSTSGLCLIVR